MFKTIALRSSILGACLLQGCLAPAPRLPLVQPALQVRHSANEGANSYVQMGKYHQQKGDLDLALGAYTYAIARDPRHFEARSAAAAIHAQQGRLDQARALMLAVLADYPDAAPALNNLGYIEYLRGDHAAAGAAIRRALQLDPGNERARNNLRLADSALAAQQPAAAGITAAAAAAAPYTPAAAAASAAAPLPAPAPQPAVLAAAAMPAATMEWNQVVPNVYQLQRRREAPPAVLAEQLPRDKAPAARLVVANGLGLPGLARRASGLLRQHDIKVSSVANDKPFGQAATRVLYREGFRRQAETLSALMHGRLVLVSGKAMAANSDVRLILGGDAPAVLALQEPLPPAPPLAQR